MSDAQVLNHATVLLHEAVEALAIKPNGIYVDGTFGRGGHSRLILDQLGVDGRLIAFDKDPAALAVGRAWQDPRFQIVHTGFAQIAGVLPTLGVSAVDGILLDIGVSSPQLDDAERGFSFRFDAPLDMRMDTSSGLTAAEWLAEVAEKELADVIYEFGEERFSRKIAQAVVAARQLEPIQTTLQLANLVARVVKTREPNKHPATRTFQAIRIFINQELAELDSVLPASVSVLKPGGRLAVISFHSLEDRRVKHFMRNRAKGEEVPRFVPVRSVDLAAGQLSLVGKAIRASAAEVECNPRARSAVLRVAERTDAA